MKKVNILKLNKLNPTCRTRELSSRSWALKEVTKSPSPPVRPLGLAGRVGFWFHEVRERKREKREREKEREDVTRRPRVIDRTRRILASWQTSGGRVTRRPALARPSNLKIVLAIFQCHSGGRYRGYRRPRVPHRWYVRAPVPRPFPRRNKSGPVDTGGGRITTETRFGRDQRGLLQIETNQPGNNN